MELSGVFSILSIMGGPGKTTIGAHLLYPRLDGALYVAVDTINATAVDLGITAKIFRGGQFHEIYPLVLANRNVVFDVGAPFIEDIIRGFIAHLGSQADFGTIIIPVVSGTREQAEAIKLLGILRDIGISADRIHLVFNKTTGPVTEEFKVLLNYTAENQVCIVDLEAWIPHSNLFDRLAVKKITIKRILEDATDYRELLRQAMLDSDVGKIDEYSKTLALMSLARGMEERFNTVFRCLTNGRGN